MNRLRLLSQTVSKPISLDNLETLKISIEGSVATIFLNKLPTFNSISFRLAQEMKFVLPALDGIPQVKVILLKSNHPTVFCAGADLKDILLNAGKGVDPSLFFTLERAFRNTNKPIISIVTGLAQGGGFEMALLTDLIVCSEKATFILPELRLGLIPGLGGSQHLTRLVGSKAAMDRILLIRPIKGQQAQQLNIAICYPSSQFDQKVSELLEKILSKASRPLQAAKKAVHSAMDTTLNQGFLHQATLFQGLFGKESAKEGLSAFTQKRKANFRSM